MLFLQSLDAALVRCVNVTLAHPWLDWFFPRVADFGTVRLALAALAVALLLFGRVPAKAFVVAALLSLLFIDHGVCRWTKYVSHRPRPYQAMENIWRRTPGSAQWIDAAARARAFQEPHRSFPSSHAANTMALAALAWLTWGRRAWPLVALSLLVGYSRMYCGLHYPTDVLFGWLLGAGVACFTALGLERLWQRWGGRLFPKAHQQQPRLFTHGLRPHAPHA